MKAKTQLPEPAPYKLKVEDYIGLKPDEVRKAAPFKAGDVIYVERYPLKGGKLAEPVARLAMVRRVQVEYMRNWADGDFCPVYRVVMMRPDGTFNLAARRTLKMYPGDVFRGYKLAGKVPAEYLAEV